MTNLPWYEEYCSSRKAARREFKEEWGVFVWWVGDKLFAIRLDDSEGRRLLNLKIEPYYGLVMRRDYPEAVLPGWHMNKRHWISVHLDKELPEAVFKDLINESHSSVLAGMSKKKRTALLGE